MWISTEEQSQLIRMVGNKHIVVQNLCMFQIKKIIPLFLAQPENDFKVLIKGQYYET